MSLASLWILHLFHTNVSTACQLSLGLSLDPEVRLDKRVVPLKQGKEQEGPSPKDSPRTHDNRLLVCSNVDLS